MGSNKGDELREREFRLYKEFRVEFRRDARVSELLDCLENLTDTDREKVQAVLERDGETNAASVLLSRLRRRPNWVNHLLNALRSNSVKQDFLADSLERKSKQIQIIVQAKTAPSSSCHDDIPTASLPLMYDDLPWKKMTDNIIAKDLIVYLKNLTFEEEDYIEALIDKEGNIKATDYLLRVLLKKSHGLDDLISALSNEDLGLVDLSKELRKFQQHLPKKRKLSSGTGVTEASGSMGRVEEPSNIVETSEMSVEEHQEHVRLKMIEKALSLVHTKEDMMQLPELLKNIGSAVFSVEQGSIIITLDVENIESLDTIWKFYQSGALSEVLHRDILDESRMKEICKMAHEEGVEIGDIELSVSIKRIDFEYSRLNLLKEKVYVLPRNKLESIASYHFGSTKVANKALQDLRLDLIPSIHRSLDDPFVLDRMSQVYQILLKDDRDQFVVGYLDWLFKELLHFIGNHTAKDHLEKIGDIISTAVRFDNSFESGLFEFEVSHAVEGDMVNITLCMGRFSLLVPIASWNEILDSRICVPKTGNLFTFRSTLLQDFLTMSISKQKLDSGIVLTDFANSSQRSKEHVVTLNFFHLFTHFIYQFFVDDSSSASDVSIRDVLHFPLQMPNKEQIIELVLLSSSIAKSKRFTKVCMSNIMTTLCQHLYPDGRVVARTGSFSSQKKQNLKIFLSLGLIETIEITSDLVWQKEEKSLSVRKILIGDTEDMMKIIHVISCLGDSEVSVYFGEEGRLMDIKLKVNKNFFSHQTPEDAFDFETTGRVSLDFSKLRLTPTDDVEVLSTHLRCLPELWSLNLSNTGLPASKYTTLIQALRGTSLRKLNLSGNNLKGGQALGLINTPYLDNLEVNNCGLGDEGLEVLLSEFQYIGGLTELSICANGLTSKGFVHLCNRITSCKSLRALRIHENDLKEDSGLLLAILMQELPSLEILNFSLNKMNSVDVKHILQTLRERNFLKLNFRKCYLSVEDSKDLFEALQNNKYLQHLDFSCNQIGQRHNSQGEQKPSVADEPFLCMLNANKHNWDYLNLWKCKLDDSSIFLDPKRLFCLSELTDLCLQENELKDEHGKCIAECMQQSWRSLRRLNLRKNLLSEDCAPLLLEGVKQNRQLRILYLDQNSIQETSTVIDYIATVSTMPNFKELDVSYNTVSMRKSEELVKKVEDMNIGQVKPSEGYFTLHKDQLKITA